MVGGMYAHLFCLVLDNKPWLEGTKILAKSKDSAARISLEAYHMKKLGSNCFITSSLSLFSAELHLLKADLCCPNVKENKRFGVVPLSMLALALCVAGLVINPLFFSSYLSTLLLFTIQLELKH